MLMSCYIIFPYWAVDHDSVVYWIIWLCLRKTERTFWQCSNLPDSMHVQWCAVVGVHPHNSVCHWLQTCRACIIHVWRVRRLQWVQIERRRAVLRFPCCSFSLETHSEAHRNARRNKLITNVPQCLPNCL